MEKSNEPAEVSGWVDDRLALLKPHGEWHSKVDRAYEHLLVADATIHDRSRSRFWMTMATVTVGSLVVLVLPWQLLRNAPAKPEVQVEQVVTPELIRLPVPRPPTESEEMGSPILAIAVPAPEEAPPKAEQEPETVPPTVTYRVEPQYPESERAARSKGRVILAGVVHKDGSFTVTGVVQSLSPALDQAATDALEQWKFEPARQNGEAIDFSLNVEVNFNLR